jgi:hypothetical protein
MIDEVLGKTASLTSVNLYDVFETWRKKDAESKKGYRSIE